MALSEDTLKTLPADPSPTQAFAGKDVLLYVNGPSGTAVKPAWTMVGAQKEANTKNSADTIDATHKTSGGWASQLAGTRKWSISFSALQIMDDDGQDILDYAYRKGIKIQVKLVRPDKKYRTGWCYVTEFDEGNAATDAATITATLTGDGELSAYQADSAASGTH